MNTRALFPLLFTVASFSASAGNWAVKNGWCQTMTENTMNDSPGLNAVSAARWKCRGAHPCVKP